MQPKLIIEARGLAPKVRSFSFSDSWSRLYRADEYLIDMTCNPQGRQATLRGQVMLEGTQESNCDAVITLKNQLDQEISRTQVDDWGQFQLGIQQQGLYDLTLRLQEVTITIPLDIQ